MTNTKSTTERAVIHINGESLFASIEQRKNKKYKKAPLVVMTAKDSLLSVSVEAKKIGIGMTMSAKELKKLFPHVAVVVKSRDEYTTYQKKILRILKRYTQDVEEYSTGNYFADLTGLRTLLKMTYQEIGNHIVNDFDKELGVYLPVSLSSSKVLAHMGSKCGESPTLRMVNTKNSIPLLKTFFVEDIWNISSETICYLNKLRIYSAYDLVKLPQATVEKVFKTPIVELWNELRGISVWHDLTLREEDDDIDYSSSMTKLFHQEGKISKVASPTAAFTLADTFEKIYTKLTRVNSTPSALQSFEERLKRHLIVPYIGKVS
jgi:nucleotidyltransferase/DNA polymerase involved in DNA repair